MISDREHPANGPEQEIRSEAPEFAAEQAARTVEPSAKRDAAGNQSAVVDSSILETGPDNGPEAEPAGAAPESGEAHQPKLERLQKIVAQSGIASRRHAEELITQGRVQVNGQTVTVLGTKADPQRDHIRVDGKLLRGAERLRYFVLNKPKGFVTTVTDPEGRPTVMQFFAKAAERLYPVGRLDYQSEGLLLVTNDGELANQLTRAASRVEKTYLVKIAGRPGEEQLDRLRGGIAIDKGGAHQGKVHTAPARIRQIREGDNPWFEVVLIEGRNRELRKLFEEIGHHVEKIRRVGYGPLVLDVEPGKTRELATEEVQALRLTAAGKLKPRRPKATLMLPKEAGQATEQRIAKDGARRQRKFKPPYPHDQRREDFDARPPKRSAGSKPEFRPGPRTKPAAGPRPRFSPDFQRPSREGLRESPKRSGGRFDAKPPFGKRPPHVEGKLRGDRSQAETKPRFGRRPSPAESGFRSEGPQRGTGRAKSDSRRSDRPGSDRRTGFNSNLPSHRADSRPVNRPDSGTASPPAGAGASGRPHAMRPRLEIRPVEPGQAFDLPRTEPKSRSGKGPDRSGSTIGSRAGGPRRDRDSAPRFRGAGSDRPPGKPFGKGPGGPRKTGFSGRAKPAFGKPAFGSRSQGARGARSENAAPIFGSSSDPASGRDRTPGAGASRFKKKDVASLTNRSGPHRDGSKQGPPRGGKPPGGKRKAGGKRNFGKRAK